MKNWFLSKTIWASVIVGILGVVSAVQLEYPELGGYAVVTSILNIILRLITDKGIK